jgi:pyruvate ferredoxin oxidoreductase alpha subunit
MYRRKEEYDEVIIPYQGEGSTVKPQELVGMGGNEAVAYAAKQANVDVVAAYPITPQTIMVERFSEYVANGETDAEFVCVESEHSAMSACVGASLAGARVITSTASQGLALMHEVLYLASGLRCPIVMMVANRALSAPINIHGDHSDMMGSRDCGWIQIFVENPQEAYDWTLQAVKIAEDQEVSLPATVNLDGFTVSHAMEDLNHLSDEQVKGFLPRRNPVYKVDPENPLTVGPLAMPDYYYEVKRQQEEAMRQVPHVLNKVTKEYEKVSLRKYGMIETFQMDDAETAVLCMGSTAGTARTVARQLREKGKKVGVVKLWLYRPFPSEELLSVICNLKALAVMERAISFGAPYGALCSDVASILQDCEKKPKIFNVICGLGGRDISPKDIQLVFDEADQVARTGIVRDRLKFVGVRE